MICFFNELGKATRIETVRPDDGIAILPPPYEPRIARLLQIEEPCGALDVRQAVRVFRFEQSEPLPANQDEAQIPKQLLMMLLAHPEKVRDLIVEIVQHLD